MSRYLAGLLAVLLHVAWLGAQDGLAPCPPPAVAAPAAEAPLPPPPASIILGPRHGHGVPSRCGHNHTGAGNIDVALPSPDTVVVTMSGVAAAGANPCKDSLASMSFNLYQDFAVRFDSPKLKKAKLVVEARVIGLLRSRCKGGGTAQEGPGCATVGTGEVPLVRVCAPEHAVAGGEMLSINDHDGPYEVPIAPGNYTLYQTFTVSATYPQTWCPGRAVAEFGADSGLDKLWVSSHDPFSGASNKDFGLQVTLKVVEDNGTGWQPAAPETLPIPVPAATPK
jgi:hypothetical protein